jgi:hypothetical protein
VCGSRSHRWEVTRPGHRVRRYLSGHASVSVRVANARTSCRAVDVTGFAMAQDPRRAPGPCSTVPVDTAYFRAASGACHASCAEGASPGHVDRATGGSVARFVQAFARCHRAPRGPRSKHASAADFLGARSLAGHSWRAAGGLVPASGAHRPLHRRFRRVSAARDHRGGWRLSRAASLSRSAPAALARETGTHGSSAVIARSMTTLAVAVA